LHTVSDVPIGVFLSGGIDSSSLVSLLTEVGVRVNTFSLVFRESGYSEAGYSREVARHFGTEHHELCIDQRDAIDRLPSAIGAMDQPTIDGINTFLISRAVHDTGLKVALSGLGADELFGGYSSFKTVPRMERVASAYSYLPEAVRTRIARYVLARGGDRGRKLSALVRNPQQIVHPYFISRMLFTPEQVCRLAKFNGQFTAAAVSPLHEMCERARELDPMTRVSYLESRAYMANTLLRDSDGMSMAHSLELRVPFVDHHLASYVQSIPGKWKFTNGTPKPLLLAALGRKLPDRVVYRRKQGFTLPFALWLKQDLREAAERTLTARPDSCVASLLDYSAVQGVWKDFLAGGTSWSRPWSLYILSKWCELHMG
jgi:asparagine synthase (glutamine-hydrolysing)